MRAREAEMARGLDDEVPHRFRCDYIGSSLRSAEAWQVEGQDIEALGQRRPDLQEGHEAFWPGAEQQQRFRAGARRPGIANGQSVDRRRAKVAGLMTSRVFAPRTSCPSMRSFKGFGMVCLSMGRRNVVAPGWVVEDGLANLIRVKDAFARRPWTSAGSSSLSQRQSRLTLRRLQDVGRLVVG